MQEPTVKKVLGSIAVIYWAMFLSLVSYIVISSVYVSNRGPLFPMDPQMGYIITVVVSLLVIVLAPASYIISQNLIKKIDPMLVLEGKLLSYRTALFIRYIVMDLVGLLISLAFLATGNTNLILALAAVLLFFIIFKPTPFKIASDLDLDETDRQRIML